MEVQLRDIGKQFGGRWLYHGLDTDLLPGSPTAILGSNGSGKSTLLQIIAGYLSPSRGTVSYSLDGNAIAREGVFEHVAIASPHLGLHGPLTLAETLLFHQRLSPIPGWTNTTAAAEEMLLGQHQGGRMDSFSSGMRQRVLLYLAIKSQSPLLLLDEPTSNLDQAGIAWFERLLSDHMAGRTVAVCSNLKGVETAFCTQTLDLSTRS